MDFFSTQNVINTRRRSDITYFRVKNIGSTSGNLYFAWGCHGMYSEGSNGGHLVFRRKGALDWKTVPSGVNLSCDIGSYFDFKFAYNSGDEISLNSGVTNGKYLHISMDFDAEVLGDIKYLLSPNQATTTNQFNGLLSGNTTLRCASGLNMTSIDSTKSTNYMFANMFSGCTGLSSAPAQLFATGFKPAASGCQSMFAYCTSLTSAPEILSLSAGGSQCYSWMFYHCTSLTGVAKLGLKNTQDGCCMGMYGWCTSLSSALNFTLSATSLYTQCFQVMFGDCSGLIEVSPNLLSSVVYTNDQCCQQMFANCFSLTTNSSFKLPAHIVEQYAYYQMFANCSTLTLPPSFADISTVKDNGMMQMCMGCKSFMWYSLDLSNITTVKTGAFYSTFKGCTGWNPTAIQMPTMQYVEGTTQCQFQFMFADCQSLTAAPALPYKNTTLSTYFGMFSGCINLVKPPTLDIVSRLNMGQDSYAYMFAGCSKLSTITTRQQYFIYTENGETTYFNSGWLSGVAANGTAYVTDPNGTPRNEHGIPLGWNIQQVVGEAFVRYQNYTNDFLGQWGRATAVGAGTQFDGPSAWNSNDESISFGLYENTSIGRNTILYSVNTVNWASNPADYPWSPQDFYKIVSAVPTTSTWTGGISVPPFTYAKLADGREVKITDAAGGTFTSTGSDYGIISGITIPKPCVLTSYTAGTYADMIEVIPGYISADNVNHQFKIAMDTPSGVYPTNCFINGQSLRLMGLYQESNSTTVLSAIRDFAFDILHQNTNFSINTGFINNNILLIGGTQNTDITIEKIPEIESFLMIKKFAKDTGKGKTAWCDTTGFHKLTIPITSNQWIGLKSGNLFPSLVQDSSNNYHLVDPNYSGTVHINWSSRVGQVSGNVKSMGALNFRTGSLGIRVNNNTVQAINFWGRNCLKGMFSGCTNLKYISNDLFKDTVFWCTPSACYAMFSGCTQISSMPYLSGIGAYDPYMFAHMFKHCTSLTAANTIVCSGNTLPYFKQYACYAMFSGCSNLQKFNFQGNLSAGMANDTDTIYYINGDTITTSSVTYTGQRAFADMFAKCGKLTALASGANNNAINFDRLDVGSCSGMFSYCSGITTVDGTLTGNYIDSIIPDNCFRNAFSGCTYLTDFNFYCPSNKSLSAGQYTFATMFKDCIRLSAVNNFRLGLAQSYTCQNMFSGCTHLKVVNMPVPLSTAGTGSLQYTFAKCEVLTGVDMSVVKTTTSACYGMFSGCIGLTNLNNGIVLTNETSDYCYARMFDGCYNLKLAPTPTGTLYRPHVAESGCYQGMFYNCSSLVDFPLENFTPDGYGKGDCCKYMFSGCKKLTLGITTNPFLYSGWSSTDNPVPFFVINGCGGTDGCHMFAGCQSLKCTPILAINARSGAAGSHDITLMFTGCSGINTCICFTTDYNSHYSSVYGYGFGFPHPADPPAGAQGVVGNVYSNYLHIISGTEVGDISNEQLWTKHIVTNIVDQTYRGSYS